MQQTIYRLRQENPFLHTVTVVLNDYLGEDFKCYFELEVYDANRDDVIPLISYRPNVRKDDPTSMQLYTDLFLTRLRQVGISAEVEERHERKMRPHKQEAALALEYFIGGYTYDKAMEKANYKGDRQLFITYCFHKASPERIEGERNRRGSFMTTKNFHDGD